LDRTLKPTIAIATGDPGGIGPEITIKAALDDRVLAMCEPVLVGERSVLELHAGACGLARDLDERIIIRLELFGFEDGFELFNDLIDRDAAELVTLAARQNRRGNLVDLCCCQDENRMGRRLFQCFEKSVEGRGRKHVDFVDDVDLVFALGR
jgi:4-hydroxy-L-threonine phosphate dehydrogenase PdxA